MDALELMIQDAVRYHRASAFSQAERLYREILELHPSCADAHHNLGVMAVQRGMAAESLRYLKAALELNPGCEEYWLSYAQALLNMGQATQVMVVLEQARTLGMTGPRFDGFIAAAQQRKRLFADNATEMAAMLGGYLPNSAGTLESRVELALSAVNRVFGLLSRLPDGTEPSLGGDYPDLELLCAGPPSQAAASQLRALFDHHGSDKSTLHNYEYIYGHILQEPKVIRTVLEIGIGSNNLDVVSTMGSSGRPGASLRAFRDFLPNATVYGADIDSRILFSENRIETFYIDQLNASTFDNISERISDDFDLIIDDGLHSPDANLTTLLFSLKKIRCGGWFVVEDICQAAVPVWRVVAALLAGHYKSQIFVARGAYVFALQKGAQ